MRGFPSYLSLVAVVALSILATKAHAQSVDATGIEDALARGNQAYATGDRAEAARLFAEAIRHDPHDPRPYYLRALCLARTGHSGDARADLVVAAALESRNPYQYPVAEAIAQLAANDRTLLNQFRWHAQTVDLARAFDQGQIAFADRPEPVVRTDAGVLRQRVSVPLDRLTHSVTLAELTSAAADEAPTVAVETGSNPFSDDTAAAAAPAVEQSTASSEAPPVTKAATAAELAEAPAEAAAVDPFALEEPASSEPAAAGKIRSGKLFGILGRALTSAAPVPSLDGLRNQLADLPVPIPGNQPPAEAVPSNSDVQPAAFSEEDPFVAEPATDESQQTPAEAAPPAAAEEQPAEAPEEDPFG